jgi:hypothetical protein
MKIEGRRQSKNVKDVRKVPHGKQTMSVKHPIKGDEMPFHHDLKYPRNYSTKADPHNDYWATKPYKTLKTKPANAGASVTADRKRKK